MRLSIGIFTHPCISLCFVWGGVSCWLPNCLLSLLPNPLVCLLSPCIQAPSAGQRSIEIHKKSTCLSIAATWIRRPAQHQNKEIYMSVYCHRLDPPDSAAPNQRNLLVCLWQLPGSAGQRSTETKKAMQKVTVAPMISSLNWTQRCATWPSIMQTARIPTRLSNHARPQMDRSPPWPSTMQDRCRVGVH
jgi:hypothetical protein